MPPKPFVLDELRKWEQDYVRGGGAFMGHLDPLTSLARGAEIQRLKARDQQLMRSSYGGGPFSAHGGHGFGRDHYQGRLQELQGLAAQLGAQGHGPWAPPGGYRDEFPEKSRPFRGGM